MKKQRMIKLFKKLLENLPQEKNMVYIYLPIFILGLIYLMGKCKDNQVRIIHRPTEIDFSESKILGDRGRGIYKRKEKVLTKRLEKVEMRFQRLEQKFDGLTESIEGLGRHSESRSDWEVEFPTKTGHFSKNDCDDISVINQKSKPLTTVIPL